MNTKAASERYQRQVQELSKQPGNAHCADCGGRYPRWASWSLGIFLCVNCAGVHRKMGTHISKVKSLTLDTWNKEQVERMREMGNVKSNAKYNPDERRNRPPANIEEGERNSELERFIFDKYKGRFMDVRPPPVPMKDLPRLSPNPTGNDALQRRRMTDAASTTTRDVSPSAATAVTTRAASRSVTSPVPVSWSDAQRAVTPSASLMPARTANTASLAPPQANVPPRASSATLQLSRGSSSSGKADSNAAQAASTTTTATAPSVFDDLLALQNGPAVQPSLSPPLQMLQPNQQMNPWAHLATQQQAVVSPMVMSHASPYFQQQSLGSNGVHAQGASLGAMAFGVQQPNAFTQPSGFAHVYGQQTGATAFVPQMMGQQAFAGQSPMYGQQTPSYFGQPIQQSIPQQQQVSAANTNPFGSFATSMMPTGQQQQNGAGGLWS